jgi:hypothetical protein
MPIPYDFDKVKRPISSDSEPNDPKRLQTGRNAHPHGRRAGWPHLVNRHLPEDGCPHGCSCLSQKCVIHTHMNIIFVVRRITTSYKWNHVHFEVSATVAIEPRDGGFG